MSQEACWLVVKLHPFSILLPSTYTVMGEAGVHPDSHWVRGRNNCGHVNSPSQDTHIHTQKDCD